MKNFKDILNALKKENAKLALIGDETMQAYKIKPIEIEQNKLNLGLYCKVIVNKHNFFYVYFSVLKESLHFFVIFECLTDDNLDIANDIKKIILKNKNLSKFNFTSKKLVSKFDKLVNKF